GASHMAAWMALPRVISRLRAQRYDIAIDLRGDLRQIFFFLLLGGALDRVSSDRTGGRRLLTKVWPYEAPRHEVEKDMAVAALVGARGTPALDVPTDPALPDSIATRLREVAGPAGVLVMAVGSREPSRGWPPADAAALAAMAWTQLGLGTVVLGGPGDRQDAETIVQLAGVPVTSLVGATTLRQTVAIFAAATVAVCTDSGPMHLAAAAGVPVVALFGRGDPRQSRPWSDRAVVLSAGAPCGCRHPTCDFVAGPGRCMATHTPDTVLAAVAAAMATSVT
ncbi:MAG TPA: glycosyltransferase family 9 protein, partial [Gemmatimonadaceae bacterium]|nr:glycosyltransferase family 9 protein [Gemmatimonadaceae bacterium]